MRWRDAGLRSVTPPAWSNGCLTLAVDSGEMGLGECEEWRAGVSWLLGVFARGRLLMASGLGTEQSAWQWPEQGGLR
jgi:hypothetical protein